VSRFVAEMLSDFGFDTVWPVGSYDALERALLDGEAHAAWAPPVLCARVEASGGAVPLRAVRMGAVSYRSALLCRSERAIDLKRLAEASGLAPMRAAWVDPRSAAGCVMPRRFLRERGADLELVLDEAYLGSYRACFDAVLEGDADLTATYVGRRGSGYIDLCGDRAAELRVLGWTDEIPNDGVALSPTLPREVASAVANAIAAAFTGERSRDRLALALDADGFDAPPAGTYAPIRELMADAPAGGAAADRPRRSRPHPGRRAAVMPPAQRRLATS